MHAGPDRRDAGGKKELLAFDDGFRESEQSWHELLVRLRDENGLVIDPELAIGDGALGFWKAARRSGRHAGTSAAGCTRRPTC